MQAAVKKTMKREGELASVAIEQKSIDLIMIKSMRGIQKQTQIITCVKAILVKFSKLN